VNIEMIEILKIIIKPRKIFELMILFLLVACLDMTMTIYLSQVMKAFIGKDIIQTMTYGVINNNNNNGIIILIVISAIYFWMRAEGLLKLNKIIYEKVYKIRDDISDLILLKSFENPEQALIQSAKGNLTKKLGQDVNDLIDGFLIPSCQLVVEIIISLVLLIYILNQVGSFVALLLMPLSAIGLYVIFKSGRAETSNIGKSRYDNEKNKNSLLSHLESSLIDFFIYKSENKARKRLYEINQLSAKLSTTHILSLLKNRVKIETVMVVGMSCYLLGIVYLMNTGLSEYSNLGNSFGVVIAVMLRIIPATSRISQIVTGLLYIYPTIVKAFELSKTKEEVKLIYKYSSGKDLISIKEYKLIRSNNVLFEGLELNIKKGDFICIFGESGSGKSTFMLSLFKTLQNIERNRIIYIRQNSGFAFPDVKNNITFGGNVDILKLQEALQKSKINKDLIKCIVNQNIKIEELSGGQIQRINLARAYYHGSDVLILDEFTSALDDQTEREILKELSEMVKSGLTVICSSHRTVVEKYANKILIIENRKMYDKKK
jgi:ABC-type multidrug transport system fused ATPase/permease subunit